MFIVAVTRWGKGRDKPNQVDLTQVSESTGIGIYDLQLLAIRALPMIVARTQHKLTATRILQRLVGSGFGAVGCDDQAIDPIPVRIFRLEGTRLVVTDGTGEPRDGEPDQWKTLEFSEVESIIIATSAANDGEERVCYVFDRAGLTVAMGQASVLYDGLGLPLAGTSTANFDTLVRSVRERADGAYFDDHMVDSPRLGSKSTIHGMPREHTVTTTNRRESELAAHLLTLAHQQQQL